MRTVILAIAIVASFASSQASAGQDSWIATSTGVGPIKVGMTVAEASRAVGTDFELRDSVNADADECAVSPVPGHPGLFVMFLDRRVASFTVGRGSSIWTARGIGIGATEDAVKAAYIPLEIDPADFDESPAANLTWWARKDVYGIRFKTDTHRIVRYISFGGPSLKYTEGCL